MKYYQRIRDMRENNEIKQETISKLLNIKQTYYSRYELNKIEMPIKHLITLCEYYNISADYILGFTNKIKPLPKDGNPHKENE